MNKDKLMQHLKVLIYLAYVIIGVYFALNWLPKIVIWIMPFILAYFVACMTQPIKKFFIKKCKMPEKASGFLSWCIAMLLFLGFVAFVLFQLITGIIDFANNGALHNSIYQSAFGLYERVMSWKATLPPNYVQFIDTSIGQATASLLSFAGQVGNIALTWIKNFAAGMPEFLIFWLIFIVATYFMCKDYSFLQDSLKRQIPEKWHDKVNKIKHFSLDAVGKYLRGMGIMMFIVFCILFLAFTILGIKYAIWIALPLAFLDILPLIGTGIFLNPWGLYMIIFGNNVPMGIGLMVLYLVILLTHQLVEPKVLSQSMGMYPLVTLIAVYVGLKTIGFAGVILFPILALTIIHLQQAGMFTIWKTEDRFEEIIEEKKEEG